MPKFALLFPGQGSQYVGMGKDLVAANPALFEEADSVLRFPLVRLMLEGPIEKLTETAVAQPAILLHSLASFYQAAKAVDMNIACALGHSLGEYSALVAASVLSFADALKAVHIRGQFMQDAVPKGQGKMAAVIGMDAGLIRDTLNDFADEHRKDYVAIANYNGPGQTVIAGTTLGVEIAEKLLKDLGARKIIALSVSAPFHCALMKPVQQKMEGVLSRLSFNNPSFPIISNVSAKEEVNGNEIRKLLVTQIAAPVRFTECVSYVKGLGQHSFLELGPKNSLSGMVKKIVENAETPNIDTYEDVTRLLAQKEL